MKHYDESQCLRDLKKKRSCRISGKVIEVSKDNGDVGKKSWAKIGYLCKVHKYRYMITNFVSTPTKDKYQDKEDFNNKLKSSSKKINIYNAVKEIMS